MKCNIFIIFLICIILLFCGCTEARIISSESELSGTSQISKNVDLSSTPQSTSTPVLKKWQVAYAEFLREIYKKENSSYDYLVFSLKSMDNSGIPNLIIDRRNDEGQKSILTIYSYDGNVHKIDEIDNPSSYASALRFSSNPLFPGLFWLRYGGGVERYGYLSVKEGKLQSEHLWDMDRTGETPRQVEISDNKQLIKESVNAFPSYEYTDNVLEEHLINEDNIAEITKWSP